jgi:hypothetical protein
MDEMQEAGVVRDRCCFEGRAVVCGAPGRVAAWRGLGAPISRNTQMRAREGWLRELLRALFGGVALASRFARGA